MNFVNLKTFLESAEEIEDEVYQQKATNDRQSDILHDISILDRLSGELTKSGYAGSTKIPKLILLSMYTRYLNQPVSLIIKGPSGAGKSFSMHAALNFIPNEAYEEFSGMSEKALIYMPNLDLKHRMLVIGEAAGLSEGNGRAFLRQLLSEGKVRYATVRKTSNGLEGGELPTLEGPTGLIMTTTATGLHAEDESRMISVQMLESGEQIRAALIAQADQSRGCSYQIDYEPWHQLHMLVGEQSKKVSIPFANALAEALPVSHFRVQRDFPKVLSLIKAHALMHFCSREKDKEGSIMATLEDYTNVYRLVADVLSQGIEVAVPKNLRQVVEAVRELSNREGWRLFGIDRITPVSQQQLAKHLNRDQSVISRHVRQAIEAGFLIDKNPGQGKTAEIVPGDREMPQGYALPNPDDLVKKMAA